jgi:hypothetical protein
VLLYGDESEVSTHPYLAREWAILWRISNKSMLFTAQCMDE